MIDQWIELCRAGVEQEISQRNWILVSADDEFLHRVVQELQLHHTDLSTLSDSDIKRAAVRCYSRVLYEASGQDGTNLQTRAFEELWDYLYPHAMYQVHEESKAKDAVQETLVILFQKRTTCRDVGSFLGWCDQILRREIARRFRREYKKRLTERGIEYEKKQISLSDLIGEDVKQEENPSEDFVEDKLQDTLRDALRGPMHDALLATIRDCLKHERHERVVIELFLNDKSFLEVAEAMETSPINIQVMKSRALQTLRACPAMRQLFKDWLE